MRAMNVIDRPLGKAVLVAMLVAGGVVGYHGVFDVVAFGKFFGMSDESLLGHYMLLAGALYATVTLPLFLPAVFLRGGWKNAAIFMARFIFFFSGLAGYWLAENYTAQTLEYEHFHDASAQANSI